MLPLPAGKEASPGGGAFRYARHRPERTLLYQLVEEYYPVFLSQLRGTAESAALLVDEVFPEQPMRQWVLSVRYPLRLLFASHPAIMGQVLGIKPFFFAAEARLALSASYPC